MAALELWSEDTAERSQRANACTWPRDSGRHRTEQASRCTKRATPVLSFWPAPRAAAGKLLRLSRDGHETPHVHHAARRRGRVAVRGACATGRADAADRCA